MISKFFIERPVLANVLAALIVLIGAVALFALPVAQYPNITPPTIQVTTRYPGASARTVVDAVALPIEQQVNGVDHMLYMQSYSGADGSYVLTVTFEIGTDLDFAQVLVQNRVSTAMASLPQAVQAQGVSIQKKSTAILMFVTLTSPNGSHDGLYLSNYAVISLKDELARLPGVGNVAVFGAGQYAMRVWLDPERLKARSLAPQDVIQALQQQNALVAAGQVGAPPAPPGQSFQYTLNIPGRMTDVGQFEDVILKAGPSGEVTRLRDVGRVELGAQTYGQAFMLGDRPAAGIAIFQSPGANALQVAREVQRKMAEFARVFPTDVAYEIPFDTTKFVSASIGEVYKTLGEAALIVIVVILLFLQDWRATLVPATTVPVTIIGTFAAMAALGFSINLSTLFAVVLAIGIVVDDAIVIVEGAARNIEQGMSGPQAAIRAMAQLLSPVIGITLVLISVFLPAAFVPGLTGRMYGQFALVIATTALISAINAVTLKPTQCALWLRPRDPSRRLNLVYRAFNAAFGRLERAYAALIGRMVAHSGLAVILALLLAFVGLYGLSRVPTGFLPIEDQGYLLAAVQLPDGASLERTKRVMDELRAIAAKVPGVDRVITISGVSPLDNNASLANAGVAYLVLKDWNRRGKGEDLRSLVIGLNRALAGISDAAILVLPPPPIQGVGNAAGFSLQVELRDGSYDFDKLQAVTTALISDARTQSGLQRVSSPFRSTVPQFDVEIDRVKAEALHLTLDQVSAAISAYLGSNYVDEFNKFGRVFQIYVQADAPYRLRPQDVEALQVRNQQGDMVPLGTLLKIAPATGPSLISLYNLYPSAGIVGQPAQGFSSGDALALMDQIALRTVPPGTGYEWTAMSYQEKAAGRQVYLVFALALLLVYLVLAGQYESWWAPLSVILAVPLALLGPAAVLTSLGVDNNLYVQIGLVLLIALSAKNAILIVEVARDLRRTEGARLAAAAVEAARARFRPILMTSLAFIFGMAPLVVATGAGASARKSIGITVCSGMLASTCLAVLFVPSFFVVIQSLEERIRRNKRSPGDEGRIGRSSGRNGELADRGRMRLDRPRDPASL